MNLRLVSSVITAVAVSAITAYFLTGETVQSEPRSQSEFGGESVGHPMDPRDTAYPFAFRDYGYDYSQAAPMRLMARPRLRTIRIKPRTAIIRINCAQRGVTCK